MLSRRTHMRVAPLLIFSMLVLASRTTTAADDDDSFTPLTAKSGRIKLRSIQIHRGVVADARNPSNNLSIELMILPREPRGTVRVEVIEPGGPLPKNPPPQVEPRLMRIADLAPVEDDTGRLLSTRQRLPANPHFREDVVVGHAVWDEANMVFTVGLAFDAPARTATKIKLLKGKVVVSRQKVAALGFKDLGALDGRRLEHPKLKDYELKATVKTERDRVGVTLQIPPQSRRVLHWGLAKDGQMLPVAPAFSVPRAREGFEMKAPDEDQPKTKHYSVAQAEGAILGIALSEPVDSIEFPFEFKDIALP
jgi:hypothetical protein